MSVAVFIAGIATVISVISLLYSRQTERRGRMPVLVLFPEESGFWLVENIGKGPALNIVIAQGRGSEGNMRPIDLHAEDATGEVWCNPIHLRPLSAGAKQLVPWRFGTSGVGIVYTDALDHVYTTKTSSDGTVVTERRSIPVWGPDSWQQLSWVERAPPGSTWGRVPEK